MHLLLFKSHKYFVFFSILYNYRVLFVLEVSETLIIGFVFIFMLFFSDKSDLPDNIRSYYVA